MPFINDEWHCSFYRQPYICAQIFFMQLKNGIFISVLALSAICSKAQEAPAATPGQEQSATGTFNDLDLQPLRLPALTDIGGSVYLTPDYRVATIQLSGGRTVPGIAVKFNVYNNAMVVQRSSGDMKLESFVSVSYDETTANGTKHMVFKQGYPDADNHSSSSVYQVLAEGPKVHLLKYLTQKVEDAPTLGDYSRRELVTTQQLYIYTPGGEMKKISTGKKVIAEGLPAFSAAAEEIVKAKGLNLKNESDLVVLIEELNKQ